MRLLKITLVTTVLMSLFSASYALVTLPSIFGDNMVFQQNSTVKIWGWAKPYEEIKVKVGWDTTTYTFATRSEMVWEVEIPTPAGSFTPYEITIEGWRKIVLKNVLIGEVWLCSGQSNMEWSPRLGIVNKDQEIAAANYPNIRFFQAVARKSVAPQDDFYGEWNVCSPETMIDFSAIGYFFARDLQKQLNVPIGIINSSVGGSPIETWVPAETINSNPELLALSKKITPMPWSPREPGYLYNSMIAPITNFKIKGVLWYQGEANVENCEGYDKLLENLITVWRKLWGEEFPFYIAQIAPFTYGVEGQCPTIQYNQAKVAKKMDNVKMIVTNDFVGDVTNIHPQDKQTAGQRFANLALALTYQKSTNLKPNMLFGPEAYSARYNANKTSEVLVSFNNAVTLHSTTKKIDGFELAGADGVFYPAKAEIVNNGKEVKLGSKVKEPKQVRYAWKNTAQSSLRNEENMPTSCFWFDKIGE